MAQIGNLIPHETATHTAIQDGAWFDNTTWNTGTIPGDAAIVVIPEDISVEYVGCSDAHIFAIRVDGNFICLPDNSTGKSCLRFDTFIATFNSFVKILAEDNPMESIDLLIDPFDIEAHKIGSSTYPHPWNDVALAHYSDGAIVYKVEREVVGDRRYNTYEEAINGDNEINELSRNAYDDGSGVTGRYEWDNMQHSLGMVVMGQIEIKGAEKSTMVKLSANADKNDKSIQLQNGVSGWNAGDHILITRDGNISGSTGEDIVTIEEINGTTISLIEELENNHSGRSQDTMHCYVGNLDRNITFRSADKTNIHRRGHFMAMHNSTNIQIRNAAFLEMGRTDKSRVTDDYIWDKWIQPKVFTCKISPLGQEVCQMKFNPIDEITNTRGRYSIHLHKTGAKHTDNMVYVTGNIVRGNPGWGITQHDSYATVSDNVVYDVIGAGIVSETGSELGFWDDNLVVDIRKGHGLDPYDAATFHDDYLYSGQGLAMKGRGVMCKNNVIAGAEYGVGVINLNPSITNHDRVDPLALAMFRPGYEIDQFPLSHNGYSIEGDGVMPVEVSLIMVNTVTIDCNRGLRSIERDMGVNHESRSVFDGFKSWGSKQGLSMTYQADYSFKDVFISGDGSNNSLGMYIWKHSHNQTFENIKFADLEYGIQVSKLVQSGNGELKTRNNGFTPWVFVDLELDEVGELYLIEKDDDSITIDYTEHSDNTILLDKEDLSSRPITFTILDSTTLQVDYTAEDFRFEVDGVITDDFGSYEMGIEQAPAQGTLRLDYPKRIYQFASKAKFEEYLSENGLFKDEQTDELYFIIEEYLPNRRTFEYAKFPIRISIKNAPSTGIFASPQLESSTYASSTSQLISRRAIATQSSTESNVSYDGNDIDASASKAVDGNNNGRINCQIFQRGLVPIGSFSQTEEELEPWYDLDFHYEQWIQYIDLWNTVELNGPDEESPSDHFNNFYILISDSPFGNVGLDQARALAKYEHFIYNTNDIKRKISLNNVGVKGRYLRIQAVGMNKIKLAEIEVVGNKNEVINSVNNAENGQDILVFPNPSNGEFRIKLQDGRVIKSISVFDTNGRTVQRLSGLYSKEYLLTLQGLSGAYILQVIAENDVYSYEKIVILK